MNGDKAVRVCILLFCTTNHSSIEKTLDSIKKAGKNDDIFVMLVSSSTQLFGFENQFPFIMKTVDLAENRLVREIERFISKYECDIIMPIFEGDLLDPYYIEYIQYFFNENKDTCDALFTPCITSTKSESPESSLTSGVIQFDLTSDMPFFNRGFSVKSAAVVGRLKTSLGEWAIADALFKSIIRKGFYGVINVVKYRALVNPEPPVSVICDIAEFCYERYKTLPHFLNNSIYNHLKAGSLFNKGLLPLCMFRNILNIDSKILVEINGIRNYYSDMEINGIYHFHSEITDTGLLSGNDVKEILCQTEIPNIEVITDYADISSWSIYLANDNYADKLWPKAVFSFCLQTMDGKARVSFISNNQPLDVTYKLTDENNNSIGNYKIIKDGASIDIHKIAPRESYMASVVIPVFNGEKYLKEAVDSVIGQSMDFFANIQIILVNDGSTDGTEGICLKYESEYPYNIMYKPQSHKGVSAARNAGLQSAVGKYIVFLDADDKLSSGFLDAGVKFLSGNPEIDTVSFPIEFFGSTKLFAVKDTKHKRFDKAGVIDIHEHFNYIQFGVYSTVIRKSAIAGMKFDTRLKYSEDAEFMHRLLLKTMKYGVITEPLYQYRFHEDSTSANKMDDPEWLTHNPIFAEALIRYSKEVYNDVSRYTQYLIIHELIGNISYKTKSIEHEDNLDAVFEHIVESLGYVEDEIILNAEELDYWFRCYLLKLKYNTVKLKIPTVSIFEKKPEFLIGGCKFEHLNPEINIYSVIERNNVLSIYGYYNLALYDGVNLELEFNNTEYSVETGENILLDLFFLKRRVHKACMFSVSIPVTEDGVITFYMRLTVNGSKWPVRLSFTDKAPDSIFISKHVIIKGIEKQNTLSVALLTEDNIEESIKTLRMVSIGKRLKNIDKIENILNAYAQMHALFSKMRVWLFMDEKDTAGSNAEYFFNYCSGQTDGISKYFILSSNTIDRFRIGEVGTVIEYGSDMHKLLYLFSEKVIISEIESNAYNPFSNEEYQAVKALKNNEIVYLPRNTLINGLPSVVNVFSHNLGIIALSSELELQVIKDQGYGFSGSVLQVTGLPKHDKPNDQTQECILFMPNYRDGLYLGEDVFNFDFSSSEYYKKITDLLCDERLIEAADIYGYEIIFRPHDKTISQFSEEDLDESITLASSEYSMETLYSLAALLITDSMPASDFAYMEKPVIYYSFAGADKPEVLFGEMITEHERLIDTIIAYMSDGCSMRDVDRKNTSTFFKYMDSQNCERVYNAVLG